jgi:LPS sulfotransferase NodH
VNGSCSRSPVCDAPFALIACQRSGTHFLREILNSNPCIALLAEPFSRFNRSVYWHNYSRSLPEDQYPPQHMDAAMALVDRYMEAILDDVQENSVWYGGPKSPVKALGLDVKYNQLKCVTPMFTDLRTQPLLLDYFRNRRFTIIHMVRKNVVHAAVSAIIANIRSVWQNHDGSVIQGRFTIPPAELFQYAWWIKDERAEFLRLAHGLPILTCVYEDLVADLRRTDAEGYFSENSTALRPIAEMLDVPNRFQNRQRISKVINRPYAEILENYDELVDAIRYSEFSEFADTL